MKTVRNASAAFTWTGTGACRGVQVERRGGKCRVTAFWSADGGAKASAVAELLSEGRRALGLNDSSYCLAGSCNGGWGMADVLMPSLKPAEMRSALSFELHKHTPLPAESLTWGYRLISPGDSKGRKALVRLFYVKTEVWRKWIEAAAGLGHADLIAPAPLVLDPILQGRKAVFPGKTPFAYIPGAKGRETVPAPRLPENAVPGDLLPLEDFDPGKLAELPPERQLEFMPAVLLSLYGMTKELAADVETLPRVPDSLKPRRHIALGAAAFIMAAVIVICLGTGICQAFQQRYARLRLIRKDTKAVEAMIAALKNKGQGGAKDAAKALEDEMSRYTLDCPGFSQVLEEITNQVLPPAWIGGALDWRSDGTSYAIPVSFTLREPPGDNSNLDIIARLNNSPILGDVTENRSSQNRAGYVERKISLKARYDTSDEKKALEEQAKKAAAIQEENPEDDLTEEDDEQIVLPSDEK